MAFPINVQVSWDPNPPSDGVLNYEVALNGSVVGSPTGTSLVVPIPAQGTYSFDVTAVNQWGTSAPATAVVFINPAGKPTGLKIVKV